jgi:formiminotetrahydrofolate cyclodeaminase
LKLSQQQITENLAYIDFDSLQWGLERCRNLYLELAEEDRLAFGQVMAAYRMSKDQFDKKTRLRARKEAKERAFKSSEDIIIVSDFIVSSAQWLLKHGNVNLINDVAVSVELAASAAQGALWNGLANSGKRDGQRKAKLVRRLARLQEQRQQVSAALAEHYKVT